MLSVLSRSVDIGPDADCGVLQWVQEIQRGEDVERNSRRIFERYYGWVMGFFTRRGLPIERAEELAQETFFQAFSKIGAFRGDSTFESWLFAISANRLRNERRQRSRLKRRAPEVPLDALDPETGQRLEIEDPEVSPEVQSQRKEQLTALTRAVAELPAKPRECFELRMAGHDFREIGEVLRIAPSTARVHVFHARRRLKEALGPSFTASDDLEAER